MTWQVAPLLIITVIAIIIVVIIISDPGDSDAIYSPLAYDTDSFLAAQDQGAGELLDMAGPQGIPGPPPDLGASEDGEARNERLGTAVLSDHEDW